VGEWAPVSLSESRPVRVPAHRSVRQPSERAPPRYRWPHDWAGRRTGFVYSSRIGAYALIGSVVICTVFRHHRGCRTPVQSYNRPYQHLPCRCRSLACDSVVPLSYRWCLPWPRWLRPGFATRLRVRRHCSSRSAAVRADGCRDHTTRLCPATHHDRRSAQHSRLMDDDYSGAMTPCRMSVRTETAHSVRHTDTVGRHYVSPYSPRVSVSSMSEANGTARECAHGVSRERSEQDGSSERALTAK
jgi:hypothetical protein